MNQAIKQLNSHLIPGAHLVGSDCTFNLWAPLHDAVALHLLAPQDMLVPMEKLPNGYHTATVPNLPAGATYLYKLPNGTERPDPASQYQPESVHGSSAVVDHKAYQWQQQNYTPPALSEYIIYELHIGTFTQAGTFEAAIAQLPHLVELGINAIEIMPVAQFAGHKNWGYDGVQPYATQNTYGGPNGFKKLIDACHTHGLAVVLDVVYNHMGPEGNYLGDFAPYFTEKYGTPWGRALNFDDAHSDEVGHYFISNALYWFEHFKIDALRLDAVHAIYDTGARPFLARLSAAIEEKFGNAPQPRYLIAESDLNDTRVLRPRTELGYQMHTQWTDDFHHALHALLTSEQTGYYQDYGQLSHMLKTLNNAYVFDGNYSTERKRCHGNNATQLHTQKFVVCSQNHDQTGNRMLGDRLITLTDPARAKLAAAVVLLSPYVPMLFMGEEHGETNPFLYFADHSTDDLRQMVRHGRKQEFAAFHAVGQPLDPFDDETFKKSKPQWDKRQHGQGKDFFELYKQLIALRKKCPALGTGPRSAFETTNPKGTPALVLRANQNGQYALVVFNFANKACNMPLLADKPLALTLAGNETQLALPSQLPLGQTTVTLAGYGFAVYVNA